MEIKNLPVPYKSESELPSTLPTVVFSPHPVLMAKDRRMSWESLFPGETILSFLDRTGILRELNRPVVLTLNGHRIPRHLWGTTRPKPGTIINIYAIAQEDAIRIVASIAVVAFATWVVGPAGLGLAGTFWGGVITAGIVVVGGILVNKLFPPPVPKLNELRGEQESPTYSISGGQNRFRRYEPMPVIMGTHIFFPDLGAQPFTEFVGEEQYLYQVFDLGFNDYESMTDFRIGQEPIGNFHGVEMEISNSTGVLTLFPTNVDTVVGQNLEYNVEVIKTTSPNTTQICLDIAGTAFGIDDNGNMYTVYTAFEIHWRAVGASTWIPLEYVSDTIPTIETFPASSWLGKWFVKSELYASIVNNFGYLAGRIVIANGNRKPVRRGVKWTVDQGQYEVRVKRITPVSTDIKVTQDFALSTVKSYQPDTADYNGRKRIALKIRASGQLNGIVDAFNFIAKTRTEVWNGSSFVTQHTSNPAWWFLAACRGKTVDTKRRWGGGLADARIDIEGIKLWGAYCDAQSLSFNGIYDRQVSVYEMLTDISLLGKATPSWATGKIGVVIDKSDLPVTAVFGMHNIVAGSFQILYAAEDPSDVVELEFIDPAMSWERNFVRAQVPGTTTHLKVRKVQAFGLTNVSLASRLANLYAATNYYRARKYRWISDWEAMPSSRGDVVELSHDLASLDYSGRFIEGGSATSLVLNRTVPLYGGGSFIVIVRPDGQFQAFAINSGAGETNTLTPGSSLPGGWNPWADVNHVPYDYRWLYGATATPGRKVKIESFRPSGERNVEIVAIDEDPNYYAWEFNPVETPTPPIFGLFILLQNLQIIPQGFKTGTGYAVECVLTWDAYGDYMFADIMAIFGQGDQYVHVASDVKGVTYSGLIVPNQTWITVQVTGYTQLGRLGKKSTVVATKYIDVTTCPSTPQGFFLEANTFHWIPVSDFDVIGYVIKFNYGNNNSWGTGTVIYQGWESTDQFTAQSLPVGQVTFMIAAVNSWKVESCTPAYFYANVQSPGDGIIDDEVSVGADLAWCGTIVGGEISADGTQIEADNTYLALCFDSVITEIQYQESIGGTSPAVGAYDPALGRIIVIDGTEAELKISDDYGLTWTSIASPVPTPRNIAFGGGKWLIVGSSGDAFTGFTSYAKMSTDGINWITTAVPQPPTPQSQYNESIAYGDGVWMVLPWAIADDYFNTIFVSTDNGLNWVTRTLNSSEPWLRVAYNNDGEFLVVTTLKSNLTSDDGQNWTSGTMSTPGGNWRVAGSPDRWVVVAGSSNEWKTSTDGINWTNQTAFSQPGLEFGSQVFYNPGLCGDAAWMIMQMPFFGAGTISTYLLSSDGLNWTEYSAQGTGWFIFNLLSKGYMGVLNPVDSSPKTAWFVTLVTIQADAGPFYDENGEGSFYGPDSSPVYVNAWGAMSYETCIISIPTTVEPGTTMTLDTTIYGDTVDIFYRPVSFDPFYGFDNDSFYSATDSDPMYQDNGEYFPWTGSVLVNPGDQFQFKVEIGSGITQPVIGQLTVQLDSNVTVETGLTFFDITAYLNPVMENNEEILAVPFSRSVVFPEDLVGSQATAGIAATAQTDLTIKKNGTNIGTIRYAASALVGTFIFALPIQFDAGDIISVVGPATADATLAKIGFTLSGTPAGL